MTRAINNTDIVLNTSLNKDDLIRLIKICLESTTFQFNEQLYRQVKGTPMGSPISVVIAEMVMQRVEEEIFRKIPNDLILWKRYVDDVIAIIPESRLENTL